MRPLIGISVDCTYDPVDERTCGKLTLNWNYSSAIADAGGNPILIPPTADMAAVAGLLDGWLIPGGDDIDPKEYGAVAHPCQKLISPARTAAERALFEAADTRMPILGICYGAQLLNVLAGGGLVQHLPDQPLACEHRDGPDQAYEIAEGTLLAGILGAHARGKSYHHQSIDQIGRNLRVSARHADGTVEAIESTAERWMIGVQWHPERTQSHEDSIRLFRSFVHAAEEFHRMRQLR